VKAEGEHASSIFQLVLLFLEQINSDKLFGEIYIFPEIFLTIYYVTKVKHYL
jgi:hypothetical protein